jgi:toxin-antitoxin system PIN domain toxin
VIAVDTNFLVYARRKEAIHHAEAKRLLAKLSEGLRPWAIPWPCVYEFLRVVTHPRVFKPPTQLPKALEEIDGLFDAPALVMLGEGPGHRAHLRNMVTAGRATGNVAHDAHIAALLREHAVREFWTTDKDFHRFPGIAVRNPFTADGVHETRVRLGARPRVNLR